MKTKLEMAHDYAMKHIQEGWDINYDVLVVDAWQYADAMQAEADKHEKEEAAQRRKEIREMLNAPNTFVEREGQHFDDVANQKRAPKVSRFERSDAVKEVLSRAENMGPIKPKADKEWQPDWSKAPNGYDWFVVGGRSGKGFFCLVEPSIAKDHYWFVGEDCLSVDKHNYQGDWRESLRKRPQ